MDQRVAYPLFRDACHPTSLFHYPAATNFKFENFHGIIRAIGGLEILEMDGAFRLAIDDVQDGHAMITFKGNHRIIALNPDDRVSKSEHI